MMHNKLHNKSNIRSIYLRKREQIPDIDKNSWDLSIFNRLIKLESYIKAKTIHLYVSISEKNEVDTTRIIQYSLLNRKRVVVPKVINGGELDHFEINSTKKLKQNQWGIPEPEDGKKVEIQDLNLIIVPMVAGDRHRNRLGYGKGYYDRFLAQSNAFKIGLLFDLQIHPEELPVDSYDIPLDLLLTESEQI